MAISRKKHYVRIAIFLSVAVFILWRGIWMPSMWSKYCDAWASSGPLVFYGNVLGRDGYGIQNAQVIAEVTCWNPLYILGKQSDSRKVTLISLTDTDGRFEFQTHGICMWVTSIVVGNRSVDCRRAVTDWPTVDYRSYTWRKRTNGMLDAGTDPDNPFVFKFDRDYELAHWQEYHPPEKEKHDLSNQDANSGDTRVNDPWPALLNGLEPATQEWQLSNNAASIRKDGGKYGK